MVKNMNFKIKLSFIIIFYAFNLKAQDTSSVLISDVVKIDNFLFKSDSASYLDDGVYIISNRGEDEFLIGEISNGKKTGFWLTRDIDKKFGITVEYFLNDTIFKFEIYNDTLVKSFLVSKFSETPRHFEVMFESNNNINVVFRSNNNQGIHIFDFGIRIGNTVIYLGDYSKMISILSYDFLKLSFFRYKHNAKGR